MTHTFRYYSSDSQDTRITISGRVEDGVMNITAARCTSSDNFSKEDGRSYTEERFKIKDHILSVKVKSDHRHQREVFYSLVDTVEELVQKNPSLLVHVEVKKKIKSKREKKPYQHIVRKSSVTVDES